MSSREFQEWYEFSRLEPLGYVRGDVQAGVVASAIWNIYRDREKRPEPFGPGEFVPRFYGGGAEDEVDDLALLRKAEMINAALGGEDLRGMEDSQDGQDLN